MEHWLRVTGTFRFAKRVIQRTETARLYLLTSLKRLFHRGSRPRHRQGNLVMFHTGRSGSSVIADMLSRHPAIHWDGELFNYDLQLWRNKPRDRSIEVQRRIKRRMNLFESSIYGIELLPTQLKSGHIDTGPFITVLEDFGVQHFILLTRRNILRKIVSNLVARERGRWRLGSGETAPLTRIHVDITKLLMASTKPLLDHMRDMQADYDTLRALLSSRRCLHLVYEDDVLGDPRCAYHKICGFLGVEHIELPVRHGRTTPQPLNQIVQNFDEVQQVLAGTEFEWMLGKDSDGANSR